MKPWLFLVALIIVAGCNQSEKLYRSECDQDVSGFNSASDSDLGILKRIKARCEAIVQKYPKDKWGEKAKAKVQEIDTLVAEAPKKRAERDAAAAKATEENRKAAAARAEQLRQKIRSRYSGTFNDACLGQGKPGRSVEYTGGTYAENDSVAAEAGCVKLHSNVPTSTFYCCP